VTIARFSGVGDHGAMLNTLALIVAVFIVLTIAVEIGDRHGFSPLSKLARAFDARPPLLVPVSPLALDPIPTPSAPTGSESDS